MAKSELSNHATPLRRRVIQPIGAEPSQTKQEFKNDCDINSIMAKYQRTGALTHFAKYSPFYDDISPCDYQTAQNTLINARQMFDSLPSSIRDLTKNPEGFLAFVQNPANKAKMEELGLTKAEPPLIKAPPAAPQGS